ncbi:MAG: AraC family transcriptional regulator ligand-binding domain-containing protein [Phenylobacterium sp.]
MTAPLSLEQLPMTPGYFRLILRSFGHSPEHRAAILAGAGVTEAMVRDQAADISLFQQVRQVENLSRMFGEGWAFMAPELWNPSSHGALGVAALAAPDIAGMVEVLVRFAYARAPFYELALRSDGAWRQLDYTLTAPIDEALWRPMVEISFMGMRTLFATVLGRPPIAAQFQFACAEPGHASAVRANLGDGVTYGAPRNAMRFPAEWLALESPFADAALFAAAVHELQLAMQRVSQPAGLRGRVERLLSTLPASGLSAEAIARRTGVSRRTLVRRLAESGAGYRQLADAELRGRAERLLASGTLTHAQIAEELGYTDPTSFSRACRRWFRGERPPRR